ncbi:MAG: peptidylprolyl isomerase [Planctomycetes bacterium]|nr:peptidylprolyl isomerase [Planctomycetota bacterium]
MACATLICFQNPGLPIGPQLGGAQGPQVGGPQQPPGVVQLPGVPGGPAASRPAMTPEEIAIRFADQLTGLAGRVQSLRRLAGASGGDVDAKDIPAPTLEAIRRAIGEITKEVHARDHPIELRVAGTVSQRLQAPESRKIPAESFMAPPEAKRDVMNAINPSVVMNGSAKMPEFDPAKADQLIYKINGVMISRGMLENAVTTVAKWTPEFTKDFIAQKVLTSAIIPAAVRQAKGMTDVEPILAKAKAIRADIAAEKRTFEDTAKELSEDMSSKSFGGLLDGWKPGLLHSNELIAISKLKAGEISEPFITTSYVEIIQLIEITENPGHMSDSSIKLRRISFKIPGQQSEMLNLLKLADVEVLDAKYDAVLPSQIKRTMLGKK